MNVVGERLREAMTDRGTDQRTLADAIGVTQSAISHILRGKTRQSKHLLEIALELGVNYEWLAGRSDEKVAPYESVQAPVARSDLALLEHLRSLPDLEQVGVRALIENYGKLRRGTSSELVLPPEAALARMFEALLVAMDRSAPLDEQARLLAQRLPIGLSQLRDLLPASATAADTKQHEHPPTHVSEPR